MPNPGKKTSNPFEKQPQGNKPPSERKKTSSEKGAKAPSTSTDDGFTTVGGRKSGKLQKQKTAAAEQPDSGGKAEKSAGAAEVRPITQDSKTSQGENSSSSDEEADNDSDSQSRQANDHDDNDSSDEEGQLSEAESRGVAGDILGAHVEEGAFGGSRLQKGSNLEKFVLRELETAVREGSNPHPVVLQLALGTSALHPGIAQLAAENQALMERVDKLEEAIQRYASSVAAKPRGNNAKEHGKPKNSVRFADQKNKAGRYNNKPRGGGTSDPAKKRKTTVTNPCDFFLCRDRPGRFTHTRSECDHVRQMEEAGVQLVKKP